MKTKELSKMAFLGIASGLIALGQTGLNAVVDTNSVDIEHLMAKSKCAEHGCASIAERDVHNSSDSDDSEDQDIYGDDEEAPEAAPAPAAPAAVKPAAPVAK